MLRYRFEVIKYVGNWQKSLDTNFDFVCEQIFDIYYLIIISCLGLDLLCILEVCLRSYFARILVVMCDTIVQQQHQQCVKGN